MTKLVPDMGIGEYHRLDALSPSGMGALLRSPAHYQAQRQAWAASGTKSKAMRIGTAVHVRVLEPLKVGWLVQRRPDLNRRTKAGKAEYAEWEAKLHPDAVVLDAEEYDTARLAAQAVRTDEAIEAARLLVGREEHSILWEIDGVPCKARPDLITDRGFIVDVKTSADASDFERSVAKYGYARQAAWLQMACAAAGIESKGVVFLVVETAPPYGLRTVTLDSVAMLQGEREVYRALDIYRRCIETGEWPSYPSGLDMISLPTWALDIED